MATAIVTPTGVPAPAGPPVKPRRRRASGAPFLMIAPAIIMLAVFIGGPLIQMIVMSFQEYGRPQIFGAPAEFVGIENYLAVLADPEFWRVLGRSVALCAV